MRGATTFFSLNRGVVSRLGLARQDVKRLSVAAQVQTNFMPRVLGSMMLRAGFKYIGATYTNAAARFVKFVFSTSDTALLEFTSAIMRVWIGDTVLTRPSVTTTIANGTFSGSLASWTDLDESGAASTHSATNNDMQLVGNGTARAIRQQQVTVSGGNIGVEHGIRISIRRGPVQVRIGSTSGGDDYVAETALGTGTHSLSITPTGDFYIRFFSSLQRAVLVDSVAIESAGAVTLPTPWLEADLNDIRVDQSGDVVFVACEGYQQRRLERRGTAPNARSWSIVLYQPDDGPFGLLNVRPISLTPSAISGSITLTASQALFKSGHVGALFSIESTGQVVSTTSAVSGTATNSIRVTGIGTGRVFSIVISGDASGSTVNLQRSYDDVTWSNVGAPYSWTANTTTSYNDTLDNQFVYYRLELTTAVAPDNVTMTLRIGSGSVRGIVRVTGFTSSTSVSADVLYDLGGTSPSLDWQEGQWSDQAGWPTSVRLHEGRLWWFGLNGIWGSISDAYDAFDETFEGSAGPIIRSIGSGPVDVINFGLSLKGLIVGAQGAEFTVRASSLDEVLTPTNFNCKASSTQGSGNVDAIKIDQSGCFVDRSGTNVYDLAFDLGNYDYQAKNLMELVPGLGAPGITRMDVQRKPDTRIHCIRSDGTAIVAVLNKAEDVLAWVPITTDGLIEDVVMLPAVSGDKDDQVYYVVKRTINGSTVRYLEKWAQEEDCLGDQQWCYLADAFVHYSGAATTTITGLSHLEGEEVVVWADGADVGTVDTARPWTQLYTVSGGQITLATAASEVVVGLGYTAQFKSAKLGLMLSNVSAIGRMKKIPKMGMLLADVHPKGLKFGPTLDDTGSMRMDDLPAVEAGRTIDQDTMRTDYDEDMVEFPSTWTTDTRVCLQAQAPRPVTVLAFSAEVEQN
jgi:hypothetical protein